MIGFTSICDLDPNTGHIVSAEVVLNGEFQDGVSNPSTRNFELTTDEFNQAFTHEFGHLSGLDHSQINADVLNQSPNACNTDEVAGLPLMFPILFCQARASLGLPLTAPDDQAWITRLYPGPTANTAYGTISGTVFFSDGVTPAQGVNVIARSTTSPTQALRVAVSAVSGYLFTGNPGQNVTCSAPNPNDPSCNVGGSSFGSRDPALIGHFDIPVPPGTYSLEVESVNPFFVGGSSVGPLDPPISMPGLAPGGITVTVTAGGTTTQNITLVGTAPRFDSFESAELFGFDPPPAWDRRRTPKLERPNA